MWKVRGPWVAGGIFFGLRDRDQYPWREFAFAVMDGIQSFLVRAGLWTRSVNRLPINRTIAVVDVPTRNKQLLQYLFGTAVDLLGRGGPVRPHTSSSRVP